MKADISSLNESFLRVRKQMLTSINKIQQQAEEEKARKRALRNTKKSAYSNFLEKYSHLEEKIEDFNSVDLVYLFRQRAEECGYKYSISNIKVDAHKMKLLKEDYSNMDIALMIEFLYVSDQDYLDKRSLTINALVSSWRNQIYADMKLWLEGNYVPPSQKKKSQREWVNKSTKTKVSVGEWE